MTYDIKIPKGFEPHGDSVRPISQPQALFMTGPSTHRGENTLGMAPPLSDASGGNRNGRRRKNYHSDNHQNNRNHRGGSIHPANIRQPQNHGSQHNESDEGNMGIQSWNPPKGPAKMMSMTLPRAPVSGGLTLNNATPQSRFMSQDIRLESGYTAATMGRINTPMHVSKVDRVDANLGHDIPTHKDGANILPRLLILEAEKTRSARKILELEAERVSADNKILNLEVAQSVMLETISAMGERINELEAALKASLIKSAPRVESSAGFQRQVPQNHTAVAPRQHARDRTMGNQSLHGLRTHMKKIEGENRFFSSAEDSKNKSNKQNKMKQVSPRTERVPATQTSTVSEAINNPVSITASVVTIPVTGTPIADTIPIVSTTPVAKSIPAANNIVSGDSSATNENASSANLATQVPTVVEPKTQAHILSALNPAAAVYSPTDEKSPVKDTLTPTPNASSSMTMNALAMMLSGNLEVENNAGYAAAEAKYKAEMAHWELHGGKKPENPIVDGFAANQKNSQVRGLSASKWAVGGSSYEAQKKRDEQKKSNFELSNAGKPSKIFDWSEDVKDEEASTGVESPITQGSGKKFRGHGQRRPAKRFTNFPGDSDSLI